MGEENYMSVSDANGSNTKGKVVLSKCAIGVWVVVTVLVIGKHGHIYITILMSDSGT